MWLQLKYHLFYTLHLNFVAYQHVRDSSPHRLNVSVSTVVSSLDTQQPPPKNVLIAQTHLHNCFNIIF